jgi:TonB-dependent receptor
VNRPTACCNPNETWGFQGATRRDTDTYQFAVGGSYDAGSLRVSGDFARTYSEFNLETESVDYELNTNNFSVDWYTGKVGGYGPTFQVVGLNTANPAIYNYRGFFEDYLTAKGDDWQARLDFEWEPGFAAIPKIQWGVRYTDRDASAKAGAFYWNQRGKNIPITAVPLNYELFHSAFRGDKHKPAPLTWLAPTYSSVRGNLEDFRKFNIALGGGGSVDGPPNDPTRSFKINEKAYAAYGQLSYEFDLGGGATIDGAVGLRVVKTEEDITGTLSGLTGGGTAVDYHNEYTDWLPNWNMRVRFSPELMLRLAATETRTRPTFQQLNPSFSLGSPPGCSPTLPSCVRRGSGGNPFLTPLNSRNYDASLEYYFSRTGFASAAVFRRDMRGFIATGEFQLPDPDPQGLPILISGPFNTNKGRIQGAEAQVTTFFDFESLPTWLRSFGVQANATYIDATADFRTTGIVPGTGTSAANPPVPYTDRLRIPDVSKWTYNLVGMYEGGGLTVRLAYNYRTGFPEAGLSDRNGYTLQGRGHPVSRLDWSSSYAFNDNMTVFFDWTNILSKPFKSDIVRVNYAAGVETTREEFPMIVRFEESVLSAGVRFRF